MFGYHTRRIDCLLSWFVLFREGRIKVQNALDGDIRIDLHAGGRGIMFILDSSMVPDLQELEIEKRLHELLPGAIEGQLCPQCRTRLEDGPIDEGDEPTQTFRNFTNHSIWAAAKSLNITKEMLDEAARSYERGAMGPRYARFRSDGETEVSNSIDGPFEPVRFDQALIESIINDKTEPPKLGISLMDKLVDKAIKRLENEDPEFFKFNNMPAAAEPLTDDKLRELVEKMPGIPLSDLCPDCGQQLVEAELFVSTEMQCRWCGFHRPKAP